MKSKLLILILILAGMLCLTACEQAANAQTEGPTAQEEQKDEGKDEEQEADGDTPQALSDGAEEVTITVSYSNDDATAFATEAVTISGLSPENVLKALAEKGVVSQDVEVLSFEKTKVEDKDTIVINFNSAFSSYVSNTGTTGEYYIIGGVCNTFLDAYQCEQIKITVEGATLETGHTDYPGYLKKYS